MRVLFVLGAAAPWAAVAVHAAECSRTEIQGAGHGWVTSGVLTEQENRIVLADPVAGGLWSFPLEHSSGQTTPARLLQFVGRSVSLRAPGQIRKSGTGYLVAEVRLPRLVWLNEALEPYYSRDLSLKKSAGTSLEAPASEASVSSILQWAISEAPGDLYGFGFLGENREPGWFGLSRGADPQSSALPARLVIDLPKEVLQYYYTFGLAASAAESSYFWYAAAPPKILEFGPKGARFLAVSSPRLGTAFSGLLPTGRPARSVATIDDDYLELERLSTPVQLIVSGSALFVLFRDASAALGFEWRLVRLAFGDGSVIEQSDYRLPSKAHHVLVVQGDRHWVIVEKGPVKKGGGQAVTGLVTIPAAWLTRNESPLNNEAPTVCGATAVLSVPS